MIFNYHPRDMVQCKVAEKQELKHTLEGYKRQWPERQTNKLAAGKNYISC